jgi:nodulation protein E
MSGRRVAVTGLGTICALGHNLSQVWAALSTGRSGIATIQSVDIASLRFTCGAEVRNYDPAKHFSADKLTLMDRFAQFAVIAAREALLDSGIAFTDDLRERTAVFCGTSMGGQVAQDAAFVDLYRRGRERVHPLTIARIMANAGASHISMEFGTTGPTLAVSTACSSSNHAIGQAYHLLRNGDADLAIAGGSDAPFSYGVLKAWEAMRVIAPDTCDPQKKQPGLLAGPDGGARQQSQYDCKDASAREWYGHNPSRGTERAGGSEWCAGQYFCAAQPGAFRFQATDSAPRFQQSQPRLRQSRRNSIR